MLRFFFPQINFRMVADSTHLPDAMNEIAQLLRWSGISNPGPVEIWQTQSEPGRRLIRKEVKIAG